MAGAGVARVARPNKKARNSESAGEWQPGINKSRPQYSDAGSKNQ